jgi:hypothetical protein
MNSDKKKKAEKKASAEAPPKVGDDLDNECEDDPSRLKPARPKIGESKDNLKQRSDWFQKRSGKK